jgi:cytoskeletal protein CcmA (bactofilin family)
MLDSKKKEVGQSVISSYFQKGGFNFQNELQVDGNIEGMPK